MNAEQSEDTAVSPGDIRGLEAAAPAEAAAVAAAIGAHIRDRELSAATASSDGEREGWAGKKWAYADRLDRDRDRGVRITASTPLDPWAGAGRTDRL